MKAHRSLAKDSKWTNDEKYYKPLLELKVLASFDQFVDENLHPRAAGRSQPTGAMSLSMSIALAISKSRMRFSLPGLCR